MSNGITTDWIKQRKEKVERDALIAKAAASEELVASLKIHRESDSFWKDVLRELRITSEDLNALPEVRATFSSYPGDRGKESTATLNIARGMLVPKINHINLFYTPGSVTIRCLSLRGKYFLFSLCLDADGNIAAIEKSGIELMTPAGVARLLAEDTLDSTI